jgi:hypothetical protein
MRDPLSEFPSSRDVAKAAPQFDKVRKSKGLLTLVFNCEECTQISSIQLVKIIFFLIVLN